MKVLQSAVYVRNTHLVYVHNIISSDRTYVLEVGQIVCAMFKCVCGTVPNIILLRNKKKKRGNRREKEKQEKEERRRKMKKEEEGRRKKKREER